jgi:hypothetical protein
MQHQIMRRSTTRRLRIPAVLTVSIVGLAAPFIAGMPACASEPSPKPDAVVFDGHAPRGSAGVDASTPTDAVTPADAAPDTPIT